MSKIIDAITHLQARWTAESPVLFKRITNSLVTLGTTGAAMLAPTLLPPEAAAHVPHIIPTLGGYFMAGGYIGGLVSKLTCQDPNTLPNQPPKQ